MPTLVLVSQFARFTPKMHVICSTNLACGGCGSHFQNGCTEFTMSHISANNIDRKLIIVSMYMFSWLRNPNMTIILVCGGCGSHFQNG